MLIKDQAALPDVNFLSLDLQLSVRILSPAGEGWLLWHGPVYFY